MSGLTRRDVFRTGLSAAAVAAAGTALSPSRVYATERTAPGALTGAAAERNAWFQLGTGGQPSGSISAELARQRRVYHSRGTYVYWPTGANTVWSNGPSSVPDRDFIWLQTKDTTRAQFERTLSTFPRHRRGKVYLHYYNEPEDQIEDGSFSLAAWQARTDALYAAIDASGLDYIVKSIEIMDYTIALWKMGRGGAGRNGARNPNNYVRRGTECIGLSQYSANLQNVNGHMKAGTSAEEIIERDSRWTRSVGLPWACAAGGTPLPPPYHNDKISQMHQRDWLQNIVPLARQAGARSWSWFDRNWSTGIYEFDSLPFLARAWVNLAVKNGQ